MFRLSKAKSASRISFNSSIYLIVLFILALAIFFGCSNAGHEQKPGSKPPVDIVPVTPVYNFDIVIYGGTPSGVMAAVSASREGARAAIVEPSTHIGGMISGGLSYTDTGNPKVIGGLAREFFQRVGTYYGNSVTFAFEPHVAEKVLWDMINESDVVVYQGYQLRENLGIVLSGPKITQILIENSADNKSKNEELEAKEKLVLQADVFIDCSYEGDLMAQSGVSYTYGRESSVQYQEDLAGVRPERAYYIFKYNIKAYGDDGNLLPEISSLSINMPGEKDKKVPAYNYRLCLTDDPQNQIPFSAPPGYNPHRYQILLDWLNAIKENENQRDILISDVLFLGLLPGNKADANNSGPFSTNFVGGSWHYPDADYSTRKKIAEQCKLYVQGFLYFLTTDDNVPAELKTALGKWGLAADEFSDNENWPYQMYIRESRRMVSEYVLAQRDLTMDIDVGDSVGMGSYSIDSHNTQRYVNAEGFIQNEGEVQVRVPPYQIPYRIMVPARDEVQNLIVPVCVSASHVAYSSLRMEPQYMILGQAAGISAKIAIDSLCAVQDVDIYLLQEKLRQNKAVLSYPN